MPSTLTAEQILALAPDPASARAGQGLASPRKWLALGRDDRAAWGECQGSARAPYQTQIDLSEPAFRCSCPSRKFPCKHGLGLFLLLASQPDALTQSAPPAWVADWLAKRDQSAQGRAVKLETARQPAADEPARRAAAQARTSAARAAKVAAGCEELGRWLRDLVRQGLAAAQSQPDRFWEAMAARMIDAQAPGLARMIRELAGLPASGEGWQERLTERLARLFLLIEGYQRIETLPLETQADIRTALGWPPPPPADDIRDSWLVLGQRVTDEDNLRVQRTWLWGRAVGRPALLLAFAAPGQPLDHSLSAGTMLDADLAFFHSAYPLRALLKQRHAPPTQLDHMPGAGDLGEATARYAAALAHVPWIERFPIGLRAVIPSRYGERWVVRDSAGRVMSLAPRFAHGWRLLAISGGRPLALFGEWDGDTLLPLSAWAEERFVALS
jgi:hypothetical protein